MGVLCGILYVVWTARYITKQSSCAFGGARRRTYR